jgi:metal-responsive CopG/Arc/MetJ family transcriptional regulator
MRSVLSISLPDKIARELDQFAKSQGRNKSDVVKESISIYLWEARFEGARKSLGARLRMGLRMGSGCVWGQT